MILSLKDALCNMGGCLTQVTDGNSQKITQFDICHLTDDGVAYCTGFHQKS